MLFRIANMIRRRAFNIDSLTVGTTDDKTLSRMTITIQAEWPTVENLAKQLRKLIDVIQVHAFESKATVTRELALVKVPSQEAPLMVSQANGVQCRIADSSTNVAVLEVSGKPEEIDAFLAAAGKSRVLEFARTGITAVTRS